AEKAADGAHRARRQGAARFGATWQAPRLFREIGNYPGVCARGAARRQRHRRSGAHRRACLHHRGAARRPDEGGCLRQPGDRSGKEARMKRRKVDAVLTEIVRNGVIAVTEEMKTNLMRTAYDMIIYEALDFTTGLFTPEGETVSIGIGLPMFIRGMAETVKAKIRYFGRNAIKPGDIYVTN